MNESEARRAALTAAVAWCSTPSGTDVSTDAMLEYAEQFETWLLRPAVSVGVTTPEQGMWCPVCGIVVAWCVHATAVDSVPVNVPEQPEEPRTRPNPWCSYCEHGPHAGPTCVHCACTGRAPEAPQCRNCHHEVSAHTSHGCTHGRGHMDSGWSGVCGCPYTAVDFREGNAPSVVTIPEQRGVKSTVVPHVPCIGFREGLPDTSYGCSHSRFAHGSRGCTVDGCACERRTA